MADEVDARLSAGSRLERVLRLFAEVRPGEGSMGLTLLASIFLLLATNYLLKPARDGLLAVSVIPGLSDLEIKAYSSFGQSLLLFGLIPLYARLAARWPRRDLVTHVTVFFFVTLLLFWAGWIVFGAKAALGVGFYLWVGIFNVMVVAQFWSLSADLYSEERGRRLFPLIAIGATAGAAAGSALTGQLIVLGLPTQGLIPVAAGVLVVSLVLLRIAESRSRADSAPAAVVTPPLRRSGAIRLVFRHRYLLGAALVILILNWVKTNSDNVLFAAVQEVLQHEIEARGIHDPQRIERFVSDRTTAFYGDLFFWINLGAMLLQALVASRVLRYGGFAALLLFLPVVSLGVYATLAAIPMLGLFRLFKIVEDSTNYSLNNTALQVLWLPTRREMKYKAKAAVDTVFVRVGDGLAAATAFAGIHLLVLPMSAFFVVNASLALVWLLLALLVARDYRRLARRAGRFVRREGPLDSR